MDSILEKYFYNIWFSWFLLIYSWLLNKVNDLGNDQFQRWKEYFNRILQTMQEKRCMKKRETYVGYKHKNTSCAPRAVFVVWVRKNKILKVLKLSAKKYLCPSVLPYCFHNLYKGGGSIWVRIGWPFQLMARLFR